MPQEIPRDQAENTAARETDLTSGHPNLSEEQKANHRHQENDLRHVPGNAYTANVKNETHAEMIDLKLQSIAPMSEQAKDQLMESIGQELDSLSQALEQSQAQKRELRQEH